MIAEDQADVVAFLGDPRSHGSTDPVEIIRTHISEIFLVGDRAFKMKRAVKLPYVDFSTFTLRQEACQEEVSLNRMTAPGLYLGVRYITREGDGRLAFDGEGPRVEPVVEMVRFAQESLFDRMAVDGALTPDLMTATARAIARFHRSAPVVSSKTGSQNISAVLDINEAGFRTSNVFTSEQVAQICDLFRLRLDTHRDVMDRRAEAGKIRRCHGDLHLRNICFFDDEPRLFDCIEFNPQIAISDVLYDVAFLLMDLWHRGLPDLANLVANRYLDEGQDDDGFCLLPFFMATRAAVRAHVTATQASEAEPASAAKLAEEARSYYRLAIALLDEPSIEFVAIGGLSGSGKTTLAEFLAPHLGAPPGARIIESDRVRKSMHGVSAETRLPPAAYRPEVSKQVYGELAWRAAMILEQGCSVVVDGVFQRQGDRQAIGRAGAPAHVPFLGVWLEADPQLLWQRVAARHAGPSDADIAVLARQLDRQPSEVDWMHLDAARPIEENCAIILGALKTRPIASVQ